MMHSAMLRLLEDVIERPCFHLPRLTSLPFEQPHL